MAETNATILIPDISGFTEFMTTTELSHGSFAINMLIDAMVNAIGDEYEVSEIEGDALLLIKKGVAPSQKEIEDSCLNIFNSFHFQRKWMQQHAVCPCGACLAIVDLTLKFVVHHGPLAEIRVGRFIKQAGTEMIVAHRLLKNSIDNHEYLLFTDKMLEHSAPAGSAEMEWTSASEEYPAIGKIGYRFALLNSARKKTPEPPPLQPYYMDDTAFGEIRIDAPYRDVYMTLMNIPGRAEWVPGLQKVEQEIPQVFVGSVHVCSFDTYREIVSPLLMTLSGDSIRYAESYAVEDLGLTLVYEYIFEKIDETSSRLTFRFMSDSEPTIFNSKKELVSNRMRSMIDGLIAYLGKLNVSSFRPAFHN